MANRAKDVMDRTWNLMARIPSTVVLIIAILGLVGTIAALAIAIPLSGKVAQQAKDGSKARARQCHLYPVSKKLYLGAARYHIISRADLETYLASAPRGCPKR